MKRATTMLWAALLLTMVVCAGAQQARVPEPINGKFNDFQVDGDRMKVLVSTDGAKPGKIRIRLQADGTWWKMLRLTDKDGKKLFVEQQDGDYVNDRDTIEMDSSRLKDTFKLEFWKAKLLGVHTHVMTEIYRKRDFSGRLITFIWKEGLEGDDSDITQDVTTPINETVKADGNNVRIVSSEGGTKGYVTLRFSTTKDWWTAVKVLDKGNGKLIEKANSKYTPGSREIKLPLSSFSSEITLEFWTAKLLGVHTHMTTKKLARERFDGRVVNITWPK